MSQEEKDYTAQTEGVAPPEEPQKSAFGSPSSTIIDFLKAIHPLQPPSANFGSLGSLVFGPDPESRPTLYGGEIVDPLGISRRAEQGLEAAMMEKLSSRIDEVITEAAMSWQRIAKDREVTQKLKEDTRATLRRIRG